jgi:denticleless
MICIWDLRLAANAGDGATTSIVSPVMKILGAHGEEKPSRGRKKAKPLVRSVTSLLYSAGDPYGLISSGSFDGYESP